MILDRHSFDGDSEISIQQNVATKDGEAVFLVKIGDRTILETKNASRAFYFYNGFTRAIQEAGL